MDTPVGMQAGRLSLASAWSAPLEWSEPFTLDAFSTEEVSLLSDAPDDPTPVAAGEVSGAPESSVLTDVSSGAWVSRGHQ